MLNVRKLLTASIAVLSCAVVQAMFAQPDLENVPISRITANLERMIAENPNDIMLRINLARTHAMAYAQKTEEAQVHKGGEKYGPYNGHAPLYEPFKVKPAPNDAARRAADVHLKAAIAEYRNVVRLAPGDLTGHLGLGWALDQAGQKEEAIAEYRLVVREGFPTDGKARGPNMPATFWGQRFRSEEAANYLIPLLDPVADSSEIADLKAKIKELEKR